MATQSTFDFKKYNEVMEKANSGLKLYLAIQMLQEVESTMRRFKSPLAKDLVDINDELSDLRERNKKYLASRETSTSDSVDNPDRSVASNSADSGRASDAAGPQASVVYTERPLGSGQ